MVIPISSLFSGQKVLTVTCMNIHSQTNRFSHGSSKGAGLGRRNFSWWFDLQSQTNS